MPTLKIEPRTPELEWPQMAKAEAEADLGQDEQKTPPRADLPAGPATPYAPPTDTLVNWATRRADAAAGKVEGVREALPGQVNPELRKQLEQAKREMSSAKQTALTALPKGERAEHNKDTMTRAVETFLASAKTIEGAMEDLSEQSREINETVKELRWLRNRLNAYKLDLKEEGDTINLTEPPEGKEQEYQKVVDMWGLAAQNGVDLGDPTTLTRDSVTSAVDGINAATGALLNQDKTVSIRFQHLTTSWNACLMWASAMISAARKVIDNIIQRVGH